MLRRVSLSRNNDALWNGEEGAGGISWAERSRMGPLRGVIDAGDTAGRRNLYMHTLHLSAIRSELLRAGTLNCALDFGCGTGRFIEVLSKHCARVVGADKEPAMVAAARNYAASCDAEIVCCNPVSLPFDTAYFDFVLCSSVLCVTVREQIGPILKELARVSRHGATLLLLEQVWQRRGLPAIRYCDELRQSGFRIARTYPIRSARSRFTKLAAGYTWIPPSLFGTMAALELWFTAARLPDTHDDYYTEYAFVAHRA